MTMQRNFDRDEAVQDLNDLIRNEIAARESCDIVLEKVGEAGDGSASTVRGVRGEHERARRSLSRRVQSLGGSPADTPGAKGFMAEAKQRLKNMMGEEATLEQLRKCEEHVLKVCRETVGAKHLDSDSERLIRSDVLPEQERIVDRVSTLA